MAEKFTTGLSVGFSSPEDCPHIVTCDDGTKYHRRTSIAEFFPTPSYSKEETRANARLYAAAPDLLEAAQRALAVLKARGEAVLPGNVLGALDAAIAKATGAARSPDSAKGKVGK